MCFPPYTVGSVDKLERVIVSVAIDSTQQEALSVLKKLKVCPSPELFMDMLVGDKSIVRRVFGIPFFPILFLL